MSISGVNDYPDAATSHSDAVTTHSDFQPNCTSSTWDAASHRQAQLERRCTRVLAGKPAHDTDDMRCAQVGRIASQCRVLCVQRKGVRGSLPVHATPQACRMGYRHGDSRMCHRLESSHDAICRRGAQTLALSYLGALSLASAPHDSGPGKRTRSGRHRRFVLHLFAPGVAPGSVGD